MKESELIVDRSNSSVLKLMGSRPVEGCHMCSSEFLAIADYDTVHLRLLNYTFRRRKEGRPIEK